MIPEIEFHPLSDIFPILDGAQFNELVEDIAANGLHAPVILFEGAILDGRNRYRACRESGIKPKFETFNGDDPLAYVISLNLKRRQLNASQLAAVAIEIEKAEAVLAKKRMDAGRPKEGKARLPYLLTDTGQARDKAAKAVGASPRYVQEAKKIAAHSPDLAAAIKAGTKTIPQAKRELNEKNRGKEEFGMKAAASPKDNRKRSSPISTAINGKANELHDKGLTQQAIADELGVGKTTIWKVLNGRKGHPTRQSKSTIPNVSDMMHEECDDCKTDEQRWQSSVSGFAGNAATMRAFWSHHFGDWKKYTIPSTLVTLANEAVMEWTEVAAYLKEHEHEHEH